MNIQSTFLISITTAVPGQENRKSHHYLYLHCETNPDLPKMPSSAKPTIAIFGATGGTGLEVLENCLAAGHSVNALARTPSKLSSLSSQYPNLLRVVEGDIHNTASIKQTLLLNDRVANIVISSIGMTLQIKGIKITCPDPTICEVGTRNIIDMLSELESDIKQRPADVPSSYHQPKLICLSTTGISEKRDVPLAIVPLYHYGLAIPHTDKKRMEDLVASSRWPWVLVRPSFLMNGPAKGLSAVRTGTETPAEKDKAAPAVGYTIRRADVGLWIFEECVSSSINWDKWSGKCVSLTY